MQLSKTKNKFNKIGSWILVLCFLSVINSIWAANIIAQPIAEGKDKFLGAATSYYVYRNFYKYFDQITPGNAGKWGSVEAVQGNYYWSNLDAIYNYSRSADILFKDHVLVWGNQQPGWISSLDSAGQREAVENWIKAVGERYPEMDLVDVVNEPLHAPPSYKDALGGDGETGWDWIITSFELARQYCPDSTKLILNEYNILHSSDATTQYLEIINLLKERGLIDGIGIQGHYFEFRSDIGSSNSYVYSIASIESNLERLTDTEIPVYITEFDIDEPDDQNQLEQYKIYFPIFWNNPGVKGITFWGYIEDDVWSSHPNTYLIRNDRSERPALEWLKTYVLLPRVPIVISPTYSSEIVPRDPVLLWYKSETASAYDVQVSTSRNFTNFLVDSTIVDTLLQLDTLNANTSYYWRVRASNEHGTSEFSPQQRFTTEDDPTSVEPGNSLPLTFSLEQNYPNPFNPITRINYSIAEDGFVSLKVFNLLGQEISVLAEGYKQAGKYETVFDGSDLTSGVYLYQLKSKDFVQTKKLMLLK